jgi:hypothetical protein
VCLGRRVVASVSIAGPTSRFRADEWIEDLKAIVSPVHGFSAPADTVAARGAAS